MGMWWGICSNIFLIFFDYIFACVFILPSRCMHRHQLLFIYSCFFTFLSRDIDGSNSVLFVVDNFLLLVCLLFTFLSRDIKENNNKDDYNTSRYI